MTVRFFYKNESFLRISRLFPLPFHHQRVGYEERVGDEDRVAVLCLYDCGSYPYFDDPPLVPAYLDPVPYPEWLIAPHYDARDEVPDYVPRGEADRYAEHAQPDDHRGEIDAQDGEHDK